MKPLFRWFGNSWVSGGGGGGWGREVDDVRVSLKFSECGEANGINLTLIGAV